MAGIALGVLACSKENNITTNNAALGQQCDAADDCGPSAVCVLGLCRQGCTNDGACPQGTLCVGDRAPLGCTTAEEGACSSAKPCPTGLACGIDGRCRNACAARVDCPRNEQDCVAGTCVSRSEPDAEKTWFACQEGDEACVTFSKERGGTLAEAIERAVKGPENDVNECEIEGCKATDGSCTRKVYTPGLGGYSDRDEANVHVLCNVTGPGWQVLADCKSWGYCITALPSSSFGGTQGDHVCKTAKKPPLPSAACGTWYGDAICQPESTLGVPVCQDGVVGECSAPFWEQGGFPPDTPCP